MTPFKRLPSLGLHKFLISLLITKNIFLFLATTMRVDGKTLRVACNAPVSLELVCTEKQTVLVTLKK